MKQRIILFTAFLGLSYVTLTSHKDGPALVGDGDRTGRLGSSLTCASSGCHTSNPGSTTCTIEMHKLSDPNGTPVTTFEADSTYIIRIKGSNTTSLTHFGFQLTAGFSKTTPAGTFSSTLPSGTHGAISGGFKEIEHNNALSFPGGNFSEDIQWTAPSVGPVTFYGIVNAVNNNGNEGGDAVSAPTTLTVQHSTSVAKVNSDANVTAYPNPCTSSLNLKVDNIKTAYSVNVYDLRGRRIYENNVPAGTYNSSIDAGKWAEGMYLVQINSSDAVKTISVVKQ